jgi:uncharacterized membrane protein
MMANDEQQGVTDKVQDKLPNGDNGSKMPGLSKELILPALLSAAGAVAAAKGPDLMRKLSAGAEEKGEEKAQKMGKSAVEGAKESLTGGGGVMGKTVGKLLPGGGGGGGSKKTRRLPIQRWTDVAVPVKDAYEAWTELDRFPTFMHRVQSVQMKGKDKVTWEEKIWFSKRKWEGKITDRRENDRIAWKTTGGMSHHGIVSFHELDDRLTRVMVTMEFEPSGMMEKMASGMRFVKRAVQADLARFKAYAEFKDAKGVEYKPTKGDEDEEQDKKKDDKQDDNKSEQQQQNGSGKQDDVSDEEREAQREKREQSRSERRERTTSK